ncbi:MAG: hypothetical protein CFE24_12155 [Flavobacterium sp. BFFFF2]|nr:MAG: hypothetical protein CFE24_12155 [Flavobacterium sp. BFFFF2]
MVRFLWASKENEQNRQSIEKRQAENRKSFEKQYKNNEQIVLATTNKNKFCDRDCGRPQGSPLQVRFLWASKENEQKRETTARGHLETKTSYEKQYKNDEQIVLTTTNKNAFCDPDCGRPQGSPLQVRFLWASKENEQTSVKRDSSFSSLTNMPTLKH